MNKGVADLPWMSPVGLERCLSEECVCQVSATTLFTSTAPAHLYSQLERVVTVGVSAPGCMLQSFTTRFNCEFNSAVLLLQVGILWANTSILSQWVYW